MRPPLLAPHDEYRLNQLIGQALAEPELRQRLLTHDATLIEEFAITPSLWSLITMIQANSLCDFCQQLDFMNHST